MSGEPDPGGDYGYDLVHEVPPALAGAASATRKRRVRAIVAREIEPEGDYGYDEAHDF